MRFAVQVRVMTPSRKEAEMPRKIYRATRSSLCPVCEEGIQRGMPIVYVPTRGNWHDYAAVSGNRSTVPIHALCERLHDLAS